MVRLIKKYIPEIVRKFFYLGVYILGIGLLTLMFPCAVLAKDHCPNPDGQITQHTVWTQEDMFGGEFDCSETDLVIDGAVLTLKVASFSPNWESLMRVKSITFRNNGDVRFQIDNSLLVRTKRVVQVLTEPYTMGQMAVGAIASFQLLALVSIFSLENIKVASIVGVVSQAIFSRTYRRDLWGVVYDSIDKRPIPFVVVRLFDAKTKQLISTTITDLEGRYGFPVTPGKYYLEVSHGEYSFPSSIAGSSLSLQEELVYKGGEFTVKEVVSIDFSIPLDLKGLEIGLIRQFFIMCWSKIKRLMLSGNYMFLVLLFVINLLLTVVKFNIINLLFSIFYFLVILLKLLVSTRRPRAWGVVYNSKTGIPTPSAFVKLYKRDSRELIDTKVSDNGGRFQFFVPQADYSLLVAASGYRFPSKIIPAQDLVSHGSLMKIESARGVVNRDVPVDPVAGRKAVSPFGGGGNKLLEIRNKLRNRKIEKRS